MKGYTPQRTRHLSECEPPRSPSHREPLYPPSASSTLSHAPFLLPAAMEHYGALDPHHFSPTPDCLMPLNNQLSSSSTFPRIHYNSHFDQGDFGPGADSIGGISTGTLGTSMSMGMGLGVGRTAMITSGSATISGAGKMNRLPPNLLDQFEKQLPGQPDGFSTLQFHRSTAVTTTKQQQQQRTDSPGKIRYLVHSVQKLFAKSQSLENSAIKGNMNGRNSRSSSSDDKHHRSKSKDRAKSEGTAKRRPRSNMSGYWSSDDLDSDISNYRNPMAMMTLGRPAVGSGPGPDGQVASRYFMQGYSTMSEHTLKSSKSNSDLKHQGLPALPGPGGGGIGGGRGPMFDGNFSKGGPWSTLTLGPTRQVCQKGSATLDRTLLKSKSVQQDLGCHFLQMPSTGDWTGTLGRSGPMGEIPCRRMRSGSYVKAMGDLEDSDDSDGSPKPSPKSAARRQSYLRATQQSLSDQFPSRNISTEHSPKLQIRSHSYLRAVSEVSINRSLDTLDPKALLASPQYRSRNESYMRAMSTISQVSEVEVNGQIEAVCESVFSEMESQAVDALDLPMPGCFRMRSHSYVRAIDQGCSQDDDGPLLPASPPRTTTTVRTIQSSTVSSCITTYKKTPPPVPPRSTPTRPYISITAQSSTESAQDAYNELTGAGPANRALAAVQSGLSNSTESIDSMKALTAAIEAANAQVHGPASQHVTNSTITITTASATTSVTHISQEAKRDALRKCLSIGIQVDGPEETDQSEVHCKFQSVGIQVEEERSYRRVTRSNSVTTAVQADLDLLEGLGDNQFTQTHQGPIVRQSSRDAATSTVSIQGSGNHYHACVQDEYTDVGFDPSILPPPDPWMDGAMEEEYASGVSGSVCPQDGRWFLKLLQAEVERMEGWCKQMEQDERENELPEDILGKIRSAVGSAQLLMSQKFQQFRELCEENLNPNAHPRPVSQDLAGFWDMLQLSIENISLKFDELHQLKANNWKALEPPERKERRVPPPVPRKPGKGPVLLVRDRSLEGSQRLEARKRLLAAKRAAASQRQSSATDCADSIEIYIPEAQTRL
ncbi:disks large-associated protein 1-like [Puntigrus tetrazona]|uniref:disks large-associated protein 1-like n=1 Tax=Puntigrus tetrazona TaxID=1606681 RepID=UPI001C893243|nr:disks large-associated protein 1-like [Puntigrus tetrazona]